MLNKIKKPSIESYKNEKTVYIGDKKQRYRVEVIAMGPDNTILAASINNNTNGYIELPGGGVDVNESILRSAVREVQEEAGWTISNVRSLPVLGN